MRSMVAVLLALVLAGCGSAAESTTTTTSSVLSTTSTGRALTTGPPTAPPSTTQPRTGTVSPEATPSHSAFDQLAGFAIAAETLDAQLRHAAKLINAAGPPWSLPLPAGVRSAVRAADLQMVSRTIPAGLGDNLLRRTILVYSDLASRRFAMTWFGAGNVDRAESNTKVQSELRNELANGAAAAARFATDRAALVRAAYDSPPVTPAAQTSRDAAEVQLLIRWTNGVNGGCGSTGGTVVLQLPQITWHGQDDLSGTIGGVGFTAQLVNGSWQVALHAC